MLTILNELPDGLLKTPSTDLHKILNGPTLIHVEGRRKEPLFLSILLHGNETSGYIALQELLKKYSHRELPRSLSVFIGNVEAAKHSKRHLPQQLDFNRIWSNGDTAEEKMTQQIVAEMKNRNVFASIDIHNNTGFNPHYACVTHLDNRFFQLATLFSRTVIYFTKPSGTQTSAFSPICPSVTVECGQPDQPYGVEHSLNFIDGCLHLDHFPDGSVHSQDMELFHTMAIIKVPKSIRFGFNGDEADVLFRDDLDHLNFRVLSPGTVLGEAKNGTIALEAWSESGKEVGEKYFHMQNNSILIKQEVMPSMLTLDKEIIKQDCLCYFMERYDHHSQVS